MNRRRSWPLRLTVASLLVASSLLLPSGPASAVTGAVAFRSRSKAATSASASLTVAQPSGAVVSDVMVAGVYVSGSVTVSTPRGWTLVRRDGHAYAYRRVVTLSEPASYTWKFSGTTRAAGVLADYAGVSTVKPIGATSGQVNASSTSIVAPSASTTATKATVVGLFGISRRTGIAPASGMTERGEVSSAASSGNVTVELADVAMAASGSTGKKIASASAAGVNVGQLLILAPAVYRPFKGTSYWNSPLPATAPIDPNSASFIAYMEQNSTTSYVSLTGGDGKWGRPVYWAKTTDHEYAIVRTQFSLPPEFQALRVPAGAKPDPTTDSTMIVFDLDKGYVAGLWQAAYDVATDTWSAGGGEIYYLGSNGLTGSLPQSDDSRNRGHRGLATPMNVIRYDEVAGRAINHVMKIGIYRPSGSFVFPMVGSDGRGTDPYAPPEGARLRLKRSINLSALSLTPAQYVVAKAAQDYGFVIADGTDGPTSAGLENVVAEGRGSLWDGVLSRTALQMFSFSDYEFVQLGYGA